MRGFKRPAPLPLPGTVYQLRRSVSDGDLLPPSRHPMQCGNPDLLYLRYDRVQPVMDSISRMHNLPGNIGLSRLLITRRHSEEALSTTRAVDDPRVLCLSCKTKNPLNLEVDADNFYVCRKCGVQCGQAFLGENYTELHDTDKTSARADARQPGKHPLTGPVKPAPLMNPAVRASSGFGVAPAIVAREAEQARTQLSTKNEARLGKVILQLNKMITEMGPIHDAVITEIRTHATRIFTDAVAHEEKCGEEGCLFALCNKPPRVLASKLFVYTVEQLCAGDGIPGVTKTTLTNLHQKISSSQLFQVRSNASQHEATMATIHAVDTCVTMQPCGSSPGAESVAVPSKPSIPVSTARVSSGDLPPSELMQVRDAVFSLSVKLCVGQGVRDAAVLALQHPALQAAIKDDALCMRAHGRDTQAEVLLRAVEPRVSGRIRRTPSFAEVGEDLLDELIKNMQRLLPATSTLLVCNEEDGLFE
jgi:hypothetical protein